MKYLILILLFVMPIIAKAHTCDTVPSGVPQLFGGKFYKYNGYTLIDSLIMNTAGDTNLIPYYPSLKFKLSDKHWYGYDLNNWRRFLMKGDPLNANNGIFINGDTTQFGQPVGATGNPANLNANREVPLNGFNIGFSGTGNIGFGTTAPVVKTDVRGSFGVAASGYSNYRTLLAGNLPATGYIISGASNYGLCIQRSSNDEGSAWLTFFKNRNANPNILTPAVQYDNLGTITWQTVTGNSTIYRPMSIRGLIDTVTNTYTGAYLVFATTNNLGDNSEQMRMSSAGNLELSRNPGSNPSGLNYKLWVNGTVAAHKDSLPQISSISKENILLLDTTSYQFKRINITSLSPVSDGLSKESSITKLGQAVGAVGNPAQLLTNREIPLNGYDLRFINIGSGNSGNVKYYKDPSKSISYPFIEFRDTRDTILGQINFDSLNNTSVGKRSSQLFTTANSNTLVGANAGVSITSGSGNTFIGYRTGSALTTTTNNTVVGASSLLRATTSFENCVLGAASLTNVTTGNDNIAFGYTTANSLTTGNYNIVMGSGGAVLSALARNSTGNRNIAIGIGSAAEASVSTSNFNGTIAIGTYSLSRGSTGDKNISIGDSANYSSNIGKANIIMGANSISPGSSLGDTNIILSPYLTSTGGGFTNDNIIVGSNFHTTSSLSNVTILGAGITNDVSNVVRLGRSDQNAIIGATSNQSDNGYRIQVLGAGYVRDSLKIDNIPNGNSSDSILVKRNNVVYVVPNFQSNFISGTYTPTLTGFANVASSTAYPAQYYRVGNVVTVSGRLDLQPTTTGQTSIDISLPISSNLAAGYQVGGTGNTGSVDQYAGTIEANTLSHNANLTYTVPASGSTSNLKWTFIFSYQVL